MQLFFDKIECKQKQDVNFLSYLRVYATFFVIFNHVLINCKKDFGGIQYGDIEYFNHYITYVMFMMTGYSYMKMKNHITIRMSLLMMLKYYIAMMIFSIPYCFMEILYNAHYVFKINMIRDSVINALWGRTWDHFWYIYVLLIIYLLLPLLSRIYKSEDNVLLPLFTSILFLSCILGVDIKISSKIYMFGWVPFNYVMFSVTFGAFAYRYKVTSQLNKISMSMMLLMFIVLWWLKLRFIGKYAMILIISALFLLSFEKIFTAKNKIINYLSKFTLIIYILHVLFLHILTKVLMINPYAYGGYFGITLFTIIIYLVTLFSSILLKKIPIIEDLYI